MLAASEEEEEKEDDADSETQVQESMYLFNPNWSLTAGTAGKHFEVTVQ
eukprot:SAG31_NODE_2949_length_4871_cov_2.742456_4_plen_49_part_00